MIPMIFATALNSLHYDNIGSTTDYALQAHLHSEPCLFNATNISEFDMDIPVNRVMKRGSVSGEFRRTEHCRP